MTEVILLENVPNVGQKYEVKKVKPGYAQNFLIRQGLARIATPSVLAQLESQKAQAEQERKLQEELLEKQVESLETLELTLTGKANDKGHLFAKINQDDLVNALKEQANVDFQEKHIELGEPIAEVGGHTFKVKVGEKEAEVKLTVEEEK